MRQALLRPILSCRIRNYPAAALNEETLQKLAAEVDHGYYDQAIMAIENDAAVHRKCDNFIKADHAQALVNDLKESRTTTFDPDVDQFEINDADKNRPTAGFSITFFVMDGTDVEELKRQGYSINTDEEGIFAERQTPGKWEICDRCQGHGKHDHPAFSNGITSSEWNGPDWDDDSRETYLRGGYDVQCDCCKGSGKVYVVDEEKLKPWEAKKQREIQEDNAAYEREREFERRMGA